MGLVDALTVFGAILGAIAFGWNFWTALRAYLLLNVEVKEVAGGQAVIKVSAANSGVTSKAITYAALFITPEDMSISEAVDQITKAEGNTIPRNSVDASLARISKHKGGRLYSEDCVLIPLDELFHEQAMVGPGETIVHACSLPISRLKPATTYIVRFLVYVWYFNIFLRWRFTADALRTPALQKIGHD